MAHIIEEVENSWPEFNGETLKTESGTITV